MLLGQSVLLSAVQSSIHGATSMWHGYPQMHLFVLDVCLFERAAEREINHLLAYLPVPTKGRNGPHRNQKLKTLDLCLVVPVGWRGLMCLSHPLLPFKVHRQEAGLEAQKPRLELAL